ncbi:hypothetical protein V2J09_012441 [Rumex salicifolius]
MNTINIFDVLSAKYFSRKQLINFNSELQLSNIPAPEDPSKNPKTEIGKISSAPVMVVAAAANSSGKEGKKQAMTWKPRFAVEIDGLHCFETILPY